MRKFCLWGEQPPPLRNKVIDIQLENTDLKELPKCLSVPVQVFVGREPLNRREDRGCVQKNK